MKPIAVLPNAVVSGFFFDKFVGLMNLVWGFNIIQICRVVNWKKVATCNKVK